MKKLVKLLSLSLSVILVLAACSTGSPAPAPAPAAPAAASTAPAAAPAAPAASAAPAAAPAASAAPTAPAKPASVNLKDLKIKKDIVYATNPISTGNYAISAAQGAELASKLGINVVVQPTSGPEGVAIAMQEKQAQLGIMAGGLIPQPWGNRDDSFKKVRVLQAGERMCFGFVTRQELGIKTVADLKGKRVTFTGLSVSHTMLAETMLKVYGLDPKKDVKPLSMAFSTAGFTDLAEGRTDAAIGSITGSKMDELASKCKPYVIPVDVASANKCKEMSDGLIVPGVIKTDLAGAPKGTPLIAMMNQINVHVDVDDDTAYAMTRVLIEGQKSLAAVAKDLSYWTSDIACTPDAMYPYHAGSIRYYKEIGVWTPEMEKWNSELLKKYGCTR